jgi:hypothetical protein
MLAAASKFINTLHGLLNTQPPESSHAPLKIEAIRQCMLECLDGDLCLQFPQITRRVRFASNLEALWFLRPELLLAISSVAGELAAQEKVGEITSMFDGLLPKSMNSRPTRIAK